MPLCKCRKNKNSTEQCPFQAKPGSDFCGIHLRGCPNLFTNSRQQDGIPVQLLQVAVSPVRVATATVVEPSLDINRVALPDGQLIGARRSVSPKPLLQKVKKCKADEENHPVYPERCLKKCKPGQKRNMETMRCIKSNSPKRQPMAVSPVGAIGAVGAVGAVPRISPIAAVGAVPRISPIAAVGAVPRISPIAAVISPPVQRMVDVLVRSPNPIPPQSAVYVPPPSPDFPPPAKLLVRSPDYPPPRSPDYPPPNYIRKDNPPPFVLPKKGFIQAPPVPSFYRIPPTQLRHRISPVAATAAAAATLSPEYPLVLTPPYRYEDQTEEDWKKMLRDAGMPYSPREEYDRALSPAAFRPYRGIYQFHSNSENLDGRHLLSNLTMVEINFQGRIYPSAEHAYQAQKFIESDRDQFSMTGRFSSLPAFAIAFGQGNANTKLTFWLKHKNIGILARVIGNNQELQRNLGLTKNPNFVASFAVWQPILQEKFSNEPFYSVLRNTGNNNILEELHEPEEFNEEDIGKKDLWANRLISRTIITTHRPLQWASEETGNNLMRIRDWAARNIQFSPRLFRGNVYQTVKVQTKPFERDDLERVLVRSVALEYDDDDVPRRVSPRRVSPRRNSPQRRNSPIRRNSPQRRKSPIRSVSPRRNSLQRRKSPIRRVSPIRNSLQRRNSPIRQLTKQLQPARREEQVRNVRWNENPVQRAPSAPSFIPSATTVVVKPPSVAQPVVRGSDAAAAFLERLRKK